MPCADAIPCATGASEVLSTVSGIRNGHKGSLKFSTLMAYSDGSLGLEQVAYESFFLQVVRLGQANEENPRPLSVKPEQCKAKMLRPCEQVADLMMPSGAAIDV